MTDLGEQQRLGEDEQQRLSIDGAVVAGRSRSSNGYGRNRAAVVVESAYLLRKGGECRFTATGSRKLRGKRERQ